MSHVVFLNHRTSGVVRRIRHALAIAGVVYLSCAASVEATHHPEEQIAKLIAEEEKALSRPVSICEQEYGTYTYQYIEDQREGIGPVHKLRNFTQPLLDFIFTHIPKAAGTSYTSYLLHRAASLCRAPACQCPYDCKDKGGWTGAVRSPECSMVIGHAAFGLHAATPARAPRPPLYLSVMREPLSRRISLFHYVLMWPGHQDYERAANLTLGQFVSAPGLAAYGFAHLNQQLCMLAGFVGDPACPQEDDIALTRAQSNIEKWYYAVGIVEDADATWAAFHAALPAWFPAANILPSHNIRSTPAMRRLYEDAISDEEKAAFAEIASAEYELYAWVRARLLAAAAAAGGRLVS